MAYPFALTAHNGPRRFSHVLVGALLLCCVSLVLHGQLAVHGQLKEARRQLSELKESLGHGSRGSTACAAGHDCSSSSSTASGTGSDSSDGCNPNRALMQQLVQVIQKQQQLLNSLPRGRNKHLMQRVQQLSQAADSVLGPAHIALSGTAAQHTLPHNDNLKAAAAAAAREDAAADGSGPAFAAGTILPQEQQQVPQQRGVASLNASAVPPGTLCLDLTELLGLPQFLSGITWEPKACYSGLARIYTDAAEQEGIRQRLLRDLTTAAAAARGVDPDSINTTAPWWAGLVGQPPQPPKSIFSDPQFTKWQATLTGVLSRYFVLVDTKAKAVPCPGDPPAWAGPAVSAQELPLPKCAGRSDVQLLQKIGKHGQAYEPLFNIVNVVMAHGMCTVPDREGFASYGDFMMARVMNSKWRTFKTRSLEEDAVVFLWDILYQAREVFLKQRWLGVTAMQQPFDFLAIADIIYEQQPDVIIETGTANGGSALMWASLLELNGLFNSSVITVDLQKPGSAAAFGADQPAAVMTANGQVVMMPRRRPQQNPLTHPLWDKYVTFVEGSSIEPATIARIKVLLQQKQQQLMTQSGGGGAAANAGGAGGVVAPAAAAASAGGSAAPAAAAAAASRRVLSSDLQDSLGSPASSNSSGSSSRSMSSSGSQSNAANSVTGGGSGNPVGSGSSSSSSNTPSSSSSSPQQQVLQQSPPQRPLRVLVLLDSHHAAAHVLTEMEAYCPLVSAGSFCVIEDTKLSRWTNSDAGPLASVQSFLAWHPEFAVDRERELLFTHHPYGYLQRLY